MMAEGSANKSAARSTTAAVSAPSETSPLLPKSPRTPQGGKDDQSKTLISFAQKTAVFSVLFTSFLMTLSFGVTQVPLLYTFNAFCCDDYYRTHPDPGLGDPERCRSPAIEAETARQYAILAAATTVFGVFNIFFTGWSMKYFGLKRALLISIIFPTTRLFIQNIGVELGGRMGIIVIQSSQIITMVGGPAGYLLALNSFAAELVTASERTAILGRVTGSSMFGSAAGFLLGGYLGDLFGLEAPFRVTFVLFIISLLYASLTLPAVQESSAETSPAAKVERRTGSLAAFFSPLRLYFPDKWRLSDGRTKREYGLLLMGAGVFLGVLATGFQATLLQLYASDALHFSATDNGWLISITCVVRGLYLTFAFPVIIARGRKWLDQRRRTNREATIAAEAETLAAPAVVPAESLMIPQPVPDASASDEAQESSETSKPVPTKEQDDTSYHFDLIFTTQSILLDGLLTGVATFVKTPWQLYVLAVILPLASGTGSSAKGTILQMCSPSQRGDALSAITLVESVARLATIGIFGAVFSAFAAIDRPELTFTCNAAVALVAWIVLSFARFPPEGARREAELVGDDDTSAETTPS